MIVRPDLKCDACGRPINNPEEALMVWEPWHSYYDHKDWLQMKPIMKLIHKGKACSEATMKEYSHSLELSEVASGQARNELNAMIWEMELSQLNLSLLLRRAFSDFNEGTFFKFSVADYQSYRAKSVEW